MSGKLNKILRISKKIKSISYLGGKCIKCDEDNIFKLSFHHKDPSQKEFEYSDHKGKRWSDIIYEINKCELVCHNCHKEIHYNSREGDSRRNDKRLYLYYAGIDSCIICGYNKCIAALSFHHRDPKNKNFSIGSLSERYNSILDVSNRIKDEIDKCDILCSNCHHFTHSDTDFFENNKGIIFEKVDSYKEIQPKIDRLKVIEMYSNNIKQIDIAKHFGASKGTICDIIKKNKNIVI